MSRRVSAVERSLLELVSRGASLGELRSAADAFSGQRGAERAEVEATLALAMNLHDEIEELRRRSHEIETLILTVADVTALRDLDGALHAICARARALLAADIAWLRVVDPSRTWARVFAADGALTPEFNAMDFHHSAGMSGRVVDERRPLATEDYLNDTTFEHSEDFDQAFAAEGVSAVLCVPLRRGDQILGVLLAGSRTHRVFTQRDISQLEILAAHAAIVLENGRLFDETQRTLHELQVTESQARRHASELERSFELDEQLMRLVVEGAGLQRVCDTVTAVLGNSLILLDRQGQTVLFAGAVPATLRSSLVEGRGVEALDGLSDMVGKARATRMPLRLEIEEGPCFVVSMHAGTEPLGELVFTGTDVAEPERLLIRVTTVIALVIVHARDLATTESRARDVLLSDLVRGGDADREGLVRRALRLGVDLNQSLGVFVVSAGDTSSRLNPVLARHAGDRGGLVADYERVTVAILPAPDLRTALESLRAALPEGAATIGAAGPARDLADLPGTYLEARRTLELLRGLGRTGAAATVADLGFFGAVLPHSETHHVARFVRDTLSPIETYDNERGTDLLGTLTAFLESGGHLADTAAKLHVHINTLYQRLERIGALLGPDWRDADRRLQLHLAIRLRAISSAIDAD
jgi:sugar diacid utilization regulator/GAF domain-containing protein